MAVSELLIRDHAVVQIPIDRKINACGVLAPFEFDDLPFAPARVFVVNGVPTGVRRGGHAHRSCHQFFVCLAGAVSLVVGRGSVRETIELSEDDDFGVFAPAGVWSSQTYRERGSALLVFASEPYDPMDYTDG